MSKSTFRCHNSLRRRCSHQQGISNGFARRSAVLVTNLLIFICAASASASDKILFHVDPDTTRITLWLKTQTSPYYVILVNDGPSRSYRIVAQDSNAVGVDKHYSLPAIPGELQNALTRRALHSTGNTAAIEQFIRRMKMGDSDLEPVVVKPLRYFWWTPTVCKVWVGESSPNYFELTLDPFPQLVAVGQDSAAISQDRDSIDAVLPFLMLTGTRPARGRVGALAAYLNHQRPSNRLIQPAAPDAAFYFHKLSADAVQIELLSRSSTRAQSALFQKSGPAGRWVKSVNIDLTPLGVAASDKRPLIFSGYTVQQPSTFWSEVWHHWVESGLSIASPTFRRHQKDHFYRDQAGHQRWMWLELFEQGAANFPQMAPKPDPPAREVLKPIAAANHASTGSNTLFLLVGVPIGWLSVFIAFLVFKNRTTLGFQRSRGFGNGRQLLSPNGPHASSRQNRNQSDVAGPQVADNGKTDAAGIRRIVLRFPILQSKHSQARPLEQQPAGSQKTLAQQDRAHREILARLEEEKRAQQDRLARVTTQLNALRATQKKEISEAKEEAIHHLEVEHREKLSALQRRLAQLTDQFEASKEKHAGELGELEQTLKHQVAEAQQRHAETLDRLKQRNSEAVEAHKQELLKLKQEKAEALLKLEEEYRDGMQQYLTMKKLVEGYREWSSQVTALQFRLERAAINFHDREPEAAARILAMLNYSISELQQEFRPEDEDYLNTRLAMLTNIQILVNAIAAAHPEFYDVLRFMGRSGLLDANARPISVVSSVPDAYTDTYYHQLFKQLKDRAGRSGIRVPKLYFVFPVQENGSSTNLVLKIQAST